MSTTNNNFVNDLPSNLMVVSGADTSTTYGVGNFSDNVDDVIKIVFNDPHRGNFRTAYNPFNRTANHTGFREEIFSTNYEILKHFRVKQIDGATGTVSAEGIPLRWVPGSEENGGGTLFIKVLFHQSDPPSAFNSTNGVIFCNETGSFSFDGKTFPGNPMWAGSGLQSVTTLMNVYKITTEEAQDAGTTQITCPSGVNTIVGRGSFEYGQKVVLKNGPASLQTICGSLIYGNTTGTVIAQAVDTSSGKLSVYVQFEQEIVQPASVYNGYICTPDASNRCSGSCCIYSIASITRIDVPQCGTVQRVIFADEVNVDFLPDFEIYQWNWEQAGNHAANTPQIPNGSSEYYKVTAQYLNWEPNEKTLIVLAPSQRLDVKYGNVYQKRGNTLFGRGSAVNPTSSRFIRKSGSFANLKNTTENPTYSVGKEYYQGWPTTQTGSATGEFLIQTTSTNSTTYNPEYNYVVGETVVQPIKEVDGLVTEYAAGKVISWEPNTTALNTIPSKLVIKRYEYGSDDANDILSNNPLITKTKQLARFRLGSTILPTDSENTVLYRSKRNILPLRIYKNINPTVDVSWYDFSSSSVRQASTTSTPTDLTLPGTAGIGTVVKGSSIGTTRIKAIEQSFTNTFKIHLMDAVMTFGNRVSFADTSEIGVSDQETTGSITYPVIYPVFKLSQDLFNGTYYTKLYEPLKDKMITKLPGGDIFENVSGGVANFGQTTLTVQKIYNVTFTSDTSYVDLGTNIPSAEFPPSFSSSYSFAAKETGEAVKLIQYENLNANAEVQPSDTQSVYYDMMQEGGPSGLRNKIILRRKSGTGAITKLVLGAEVKCVASDIIKNKIDVQFTEVAKLRYQTSGEFAGKWIAEIPRYEVTDLISVFFKGSGNTMISTNQVDIFGFANQINDYSYNKTLLILGPNGLKNNDNTDITVGPITPQVPAYGVYTQDDTSPTKYYVEIYVTGVGKYINENTAGIVLRESYKDFNNTTVSVRDIPYYTSKVDGQIYHASSILDYRPIMDSKNEAGNTKFVLLPTSSTINSTLGAYLPRKDVLYINKDGLIKIVYGEPDVLPLYPVLPEPGMILYRIEKPSYVFSSKDLSLFYTDNKRYTMKDIGKIERRVEQLEKYSTLSLLEKTADSLLIEDAEGNNRFKNGIIVDPFENHKIGDVGHPDYNISVDASKKCIRPKFTNIPLSLSPFETNTTFIEVFNTKTGVTGTTENGAVSTGLFMFPFSQVPFVVQPLATRAMTVTPFEVVTMEGVLRLFPREDDWVDTTTLPEVTVDLSGNNEVWTQVLDSINSQDNGPFALNYGNWQTYNTQVTQVVGSGGSAAFVANVGRNTLQTTTTTQATRTVTGEQLTSSTENVSLGERVVDVSLIPYMRAKRIRIVATGLKPNSRMYPFFDGIDVSQYCYAYNSVAEMNQAIRSPTLDAANKFTTSIIRKTNSRGSAFIIFDMPAGIFRTGDRKFSVSDNANNDYTRASTYAGATYSAFGLSQTRQSSSAVIRTFDTETVNFTEDGTFTTVSYQRIDPLAQTFTVNRELYPEGIFLSSVDIFFARKPNNDTNVPVKVEIRPTINGFPDINKIHAGGTCILHPSQVNVSDFPAANNAQTATRFVFEHPVYLEPGEHCLVVRSTTEEYEIYVAEIGQTILNSTQRVSEQPYVGVFFRSSNASTWVPEPTMDMMMTLNKCEFTTNTQYKFTAKTDSVGKNLEYELLNFGNSYQEFQSCALTWEMGTAPNSPNYITPNQNITYNTTQTLLNANNLYFTASAITTNKDVCPIINTERMTLFVVKNLIENNNDLNVNTELNPYATETEKIRGRYITKIVTLEEGFESNGFKLILSVNKPVGTKIQTFLKYQTVEQTSNFHQNEYVQLIPKMGLTQFDNYYTQFENQFVDIEFDLPQDTPIEFNRFAIKICLYSDNAASVPQVKDLRGIAVL